VKVSIESTATSVDALTLKKFFLSLVLLVGSPVLGDFELPDDSAESSDWVSGRNDCWGTALVSNDTSPSQITGNSF
jgi:hypothetical protein